jgi:hypothetical protein
MTATKPDPSLSNSLTDLAARIRAEHGARGAALKRGSRTRYCGRENADRS